MKRLPWIALVAVAGIGSAVVAAQNGKKTTLDAIATAMGSTNLKTIQYSGNGSNFALGQSPNATAPWPRFNVTSYTASINYDEPAMRVEIIRTQGENPPRGGGGQPLAGEQRQTQVAGGNQAWNVSGGNATPAPAALNERILQFWVTPHGFVKGAQRQNATVKPQARGGVKTTLVSFAAPEPHKWRFQGTVNSQNLVEKVETWIDNPVLGDMLIETTYSDYKDFGGVKFPTKIVQKQGGAPTLELTIADVQPNAPVTIEVPANVKDATPPPVRVESEKIAEGVWYLTGGSHHSVLVEFKDHVAVIEGPQNEERSLAVIGEVKKLVPSKPIRYLVNTHQHFDHAGGIRTYAAEGATIVTHQIYKPYYEKVFAHPRTLSPDRLAQAKGKAKIEAVVGQKVLFDKGGRELALHHIRGNTHNDGILMAYLPQEGILIEADVFTPPAPNAPPPATPNPFSVNFYENIQRLKLDVKQIAPLHGRLVTLDDLRKAIGK
jgi:glyoxylase-like metal-dependent hydrolase (beta-lactamase superfamily II)